MKQKALFFIQSNCGGAERMAIRIASYLDKSKYDVIFYIIGQDLGVIQQFISPDVPVKLIKVKSFKDFLIWKILAVLVKEKPSYVFSTTFPINARLSLAASLIPKTRTILRSDNYLYTQSFFQKVRIFMAYHLAHKVVAQTEEMRDEFGKVLKLKSSKSVTFANTIDVEMINNKLAGKDSPFDSTHLNFVYVGRLDPVKGLEMLLPAFRLLKDTNPAVRLYIVGEKDGAYESYFNKLKGMTEELGINDAVIFVGFTNNPYTYMKYADTLVLPSRSEGLPNVVIESLFLGTPVAVTNCIPVIKRIVNEGANGFISEVDDVEGFKTAMENASKLGRVVTTYSSATKEDFQNLFSRS